jgi:hypothetical protein
MLKQNSLFGDELPIEDHTGMKVGDLRRPINDWAWCVYALIIEKRWIDFFTVAKRYGMIKFQTRIAEVSKMFPALVEKRNKTIVTQFGKKAEITQYRIPDKQAAMKIYTDCINRKNALKLMRDEFAGRGGC